MWRDKIKKALRKQLTGNDRKEDLFKLMKTEKDRDCYHGGLWGRGTDIGELDKGV